MAAIIVICTYLMRRFGAAHAFFYYVSQRPAPDILKIVALLLCVPRTSVTDCSSNAISSRSAGSTLGSCRAR